MQYAEAFDTPNDRRHTGSLKWDVAEGELPMWVADMDFKTALEIRAALTEVAERGIYGYSVIPDEWYAAYAGWWETRHGFALKKEWLTFSNGVVAAISSAVRKLTTPAEKVVVQTPVYNIFFHSIRNNGREVLENPLIYDKERRTYAVDFDDLERKLSDPQTTLMILCNPQNPVGKIWDRDTLEKIGTLCARHHVVVLSDEIHCDLCDPGRAYVPFASVSDVCRDNSVTCIAPTKTFNLAGIQTAAVSVPNPFLRHKLECALNTDEAAEPNIFAVPAAIAAYTTGAPWLDALRSYLYDGKTIVKTFLEKELPDVQLIPSDATYLLWLDVSAVCPSSSALAAFLREKTGLFLTAGSQYGGNGSGFLRMNIACPHTVLRDGLLRLKKGVDAYLGERQNEK